MGALWERGSPVADAWVSSPSLHFGHPPSPGLLNTAQATRPSSPATADLICEELVLSKANKVLQNLALT